MDAVQQATQSDDGEGVPYQVQYAYRRDGDEQIWLEDTGRWFAGADGKPLRAHGVVRVINERRERERQLMQLAKFDPVTCGLNRAHLAELLGAKLDEAMRFRHSLGFLLIAITWPTSTSLMVSMSPKT